MGCPLCSIEPAGVSQHCILFRSIAYVQLQRRNYQSRREESATAIWPYAAGRPGQSPTSGFA